MNILIFGPNGSGKGTQGDLIKQKYNLAHIESGAIFREHIGGGTELGKKAKAFIDRGDLVPDDITIPMLEARLRNAENEYRWYRIEASNITNTQGAPIYTIGIITDIDQQKNLEQRLRSQASRDSGTGMAVRLFSERLAVAIHARGNPAASRSKYRGTTAFSSREYKASASA